eukprot:SAG11_NODE_11474_length_758_cov_1.770865_1_plen_81_part_00
MIPRPTSMHTTVPIGTSWANTMAVEWVYRNAARDGDGATVQKQLCDLGCPVICVDVCYKCLFEGLIQPTAPIFISACGWI